jgi:hypothetical protein
MQAKSISEQEPRTNIWSKERLEWRVDKAPYIASELLNLLVEERVKQAKRKKLEL